MDGQHRQKDGAGRDLHVQAGGVLSQVAVGQHDALALSGGAGGKEDGAQLIRVGAEGMAGRAVLLQGSEGQGALAALFLLHGNDVF